MRSFIVHVESTETIGENFHYPLLSTVFETREKWYWDICYSTCTYSPYIYIYICVTVCSNESIRGYVSIRAPEITNITGNHSVAC